MSGSNQFFSYPSYYDKNNLIKDIVALIQFHRATFKLNDYNDLGEKDIQIEIRIVDDQYFTVKIQANLENAHLAAVEEGPILEEALDTAKNKFVRNYIHWSELQRRVPVAFGLDRTIENEAYMQVSEGEAQKTFTGLKVLVLEDDPAASRVLESLIQKNGCQVEMTDDPINVIQHFGLDVYNLIILDWNLPCLTGKEFLEKLDEKLDSLKIPGEVYNKIPVVICSSEKKNQVLVPYLNNFIILDYLDKSIPLTSAIVSVFQDLKRIRRTKRFPLSSNAS